MELVFKGLTFGVRLGEVHESTTVWSGGFDEVAGDDGDGSHTVTARRVLLQFNMYVIKKVFKKWCVYFKTLKQVCTCDHHKSTAV